MQFLQGLTALITNPVLANGVAGLATSACSQATVQVSLSHACMHASSSVYVVMALVALLRVCVVLYCVFPIVLTARVLVPQRMLLWQRRNNTVAPFNETVQQVFARISAFRDSLDGPQVCTTPSSFVYTPSFTLGRQ